MDRKGKIVGEARRYDPYSRFGDILLYEVDVFGFCPGFIHADWTLMSERDIKENEKLRKELKQTIYDLWRRRNILELVTKYEKGNQQQSFTEFCRLEYERIPNDE